MEHNLIHQGLATPIRRKHAEDDAAGWEDFVESQRALESVLSCLSGVFYRCALQPPWQTSFVSAGAFGLTGYPAEEFMSHKAWAEIMRPEDRNAVEAEIAEAIAQKRSFDVTYRITKKCGDIVWVSERGQAVFSDMGRPLFLEGIISDISGRKEADELQKTMMRRWMHTLDAIPQMVWTMASDGSDEYYNAQWTNFTGCRVGSPEGVCRHELIHEHDRARVVALWDDKFTSGEPYEAQYRLRHATGEYRWILSRGDCDKDPQGNPIRWYGTCTDIHQEVMGRHALQASDSINRSMIEASPDCISLLDTNGKTKFVNQASLGALGLESSISLLGRHWISSFSYSFRTAAQLALDHAFSGKTGHFTAAQSSKHGPRWWDVVVAPIHSEGQLTGLISIARDVTNQKTAEEKVRWSANHDALTQLPNRTLFQCVFDRLLSENKTSGNGLAVLIMDLDDFKRTNDALGHDAGDALLCEFARRLRSAVGPEDLIARLGGDEFAILLTKVSDEARLTTIVSRISERLILPFEYDGKLLDIRTSVGASIYPDHGLTRAELLKHADIALYAAKGSGKGALRIFEAEMRAEAQKRASMLSLARSALRENRVMANYQPKVDLRTGNLDGFEALLRWQHPRKGLQAPDTIAAAFQDGLLAAEISDRIIQSVIADMTVWTEQGIQFGHVAINAGAAEFRTGDFADKLLERLSRANLPTSLLQLEVTETVFLGRGAEHVEETLRALSKEGIMIALDDFGTGYASLSHLNKFPVDVIKIDRSFISNLQTSAHDAAIVRAVIKLGRSLGIKIVAEGIENAHQAGFLKKRRCHSGQGYLFGKAVPAAMIPSLIQSWDKSAV